MKKTYIVLGLLCASISLKAQILTNKKLEVKTKAGQRVDQKTSEAIDKGFDKVEDGINSIFKKKDKTKNSNSEESTETEENGSQENQSTGSSNTNGNESNESSSIKSYSKYDFVSGEKILYYDDFSNTSVGDFPADINTNASGEIVTLSNKEGKWLNMTKNGFFQPESMGQLPDNFTLEFEVGLEGSPSNNYSGLGLHFDINKDELAKEMFFEKGASIVYLHPGAAQASIFVRPLNGVELSNDIPMPMWSDEGSRFAKVSVWRQKSRLRVYVNESKLIDVPRFFSEAQPYYFSFFRSFFNECSLFMTNIKYAIGAPDTRNKLITEGKFSTTGILFDVNSDKIKANSSGTLKEIATVLTENSGVRIKIVGHTDSDGDDSANMLLSQKRAEAVKKALVDNFNIAGTRIETAGKGETQPVSDNNSAAGKASNRRVEFIKL